MKHANGFPSSFLLLLVHLGLSSSLFYRCCFRCDSLSILFFFFFFYLVFVNIEIVLSANSHRIDFYTHSSDQREENSRAADCFR